MATDEPPVYEFGDFRLDVRDQETVVDALGTRLGWGQNNPAFRQLFTTRFIGRGHPGIDVRPTAQPKSPPA